MFTFKYPVVNLMVFAHAMAGEMGAEIINNRFIIPQAIGSGYVQLIDLPNESAALIMNFTLNTDIHYEESQSAQELYSIRFEDNYVPDSLTTQIDGDYKNDQRAMHASVYMASSFFDLGYFFSKGTHLRCITVQLETQWMNKYLEMELFESILGRYLSLKTASLNIEPLDAEYRKILSEIIQVAKDSPTHVTSIQNLIMIMIMIERFFDHLYQKRDQFKNKINISREDLEQVRKVEHAITADIFKPCPTISELVKTVCISQTKLKALFKDVYGKPIHKYYQYHRMQNAKAMLILKQHTVKEVGMSLGYKNSSSFDTAFYKEFNALPIDF